MLNKEEILDQARMRDCKNLANNYESTLLRLIVSVFNSHIPLKSAQIKNIQFRSYNEDVHLIYEGRRGSDVL